MVPEITMLAAKGRGAVKQTYQAAAPMNHNDDQHVKISIHKGALNGTHMVTNICVIGLKAHTMGG